jgi:recombination protein RecA
VVRKKGQLSRAATLVNEVNATLKTNVMLGSNPYFELTRIPTGSLVLDRITGGGFALGRHVEIFGDENSAKSYTSYRTMALSQQRGNLCALVDPEHSFEPEWFAHLGGDPDLLLTFHPENAEDAIAVMMLLAKHAEENTIEVITVDSVASMVPNEEMTRDPRDEDRLGAQARMMSRALRRITTVNKKTLFIWINQERANIGIRFGNPRTTSGGRALRFYATTRIEMRRGTKVTTKRKVASVSKLVEREVQMGRWIFCRCEKDKSTRPYREGSFIFSTASNAIDLGSEVIQLGLEDGLIERSGNFLIYEDVDGHTWKHSEKQMRKLINEPGDLQTELVTVIRDNTIHQELELGA